MSELYSRPHAPHRASHASDGSHSRSPVASWQSDRTPSIGRISSILAALLVTLAVALALFPEAASAQRSGQVDRQLEGVGIDEKLGETIPLDLKFTTADGKEVSLASYFEDGKPVLLNFGYYRCPMLCDRIWNGMSASLQELDWNAGEEFRIVTIGVAPMETPADARKKRDRVLGMVEELKPGYGWHFHTGEKAQVDRLAEAVGFRYRKMDRSAQMDASYQQYAHPAVLVALSPNGKISRYLYGIRFDDRAMKNALVEASNGEVGSVVDRLIMYCSQYDPEANEYVADAFALMRVAGVVTVLVLGGVLFFYWRRERRQLAAQG